MPLYMVQVLELLVKDSHITGRTEVARASVKLQDLIHSVTTGTVTTSSGTDAHHMWLPLKPVEGVGSAMGLGRVANADGNAGEVELVISYRVR